MSANPSISTHTGWRKLIWLGLAVVFLAAVVAWNQYQMAQQNSRPMPGQAAGKGGAPAAGGQQGGAGGRPAEEAVVAASVRVVEVTAATYQAELSGYGSAEAHFQLSLTARVAGNIERITDLFDSGRRVAQGAVLATLENSSYQAEVAEAEQDVADARLALLEEQREVEQALDEWQAAGLSGEPDSPLLLREPQLAAAEAALKNAEAALRSARKQLSWTRITAPFDALVVERLVSPGEYVSAGGDIATLYSTDRVEVSVALSEQEWAMLPGIETLLDGQWPVTLTSVESDGQWQGVVLRAEQHMDEETRQRALIVAVEKPLDQQPMLQPGLFVKVSLLGKSVDQLWKLPASALSQRGEIWLVNDRDLLEKYVADTLFSDANFIYTSVPEGLSGTHKVVVQPLSSYVEKSLVKPVVLTLGKTGIVDAQTEETTYE
ncbi:MULTISPECIES: efflux RND transporter periplasmic adaptor subunit [unclassified Oceanobacter]|uniref:efflux RND transporter periplasmic adaptor subunit n=1 Tax=unclassified Oceanobacter TaxID=2620260 RepID=UPI0026E36076|nr:MULTISPECIES: efflux RND transporter periplasmic adaptor subunit [unclassified Oceanobacter]MDO6682491.1 efflux RND transporter periplasmic adaptor subunit [Oceanobacter sp. 5_MG-2023]MDP2548997.1 efflux RND transporter periplasmic adaptor subunit [Oceanobacter sp. 4_MG-2023]